MSVAPITYLYITTYCNLAFKNIRIKSNRICIHLLENVFPLTPTLTLTLKSTMFSDWRNDVIYRSSLHCTLQRYLSNLS